MVLVGDVEARPAGLERGLLRAGFQVAEADEAGALPGRPAVVLATCPVLSPNCGELVSGLAAARAAGAQVVVLLPGGQPDDLVRAAEAGADEAILLPAEEAQLLARVRARVHAPRVSRQGPAGHDQRLFDVLQAVATEMHRDDMLHALVRGAARALDVRSVHCLLHAEEATIGRLVASSSDPKLRDADTELANWPDAVSALATRSTLFVPDVRSEATFAVRTAGMTRDLRSSLAVPLSPFGRPIGTLVLRTTEGEPPLTRAHLAFVEALVTAVGRLLEVDDRRSAMARRQVLAAHVDPLTGCGTLDALDRRIREEFERARRYHVCFSLVLLDVDQMRVINEHLGRDGGEQVLAHLGRLLQRELRSPDFVARYGGEEFLLLLPETDTAGARLGVQRLRTLLEPAGLAEAHLGTRVRLSAGIVTYPHPAVHRPEDLFALVETALLDGKARDPERIGAAA
ncbi:MAG TPA: sensor domain-containing diguanylate cyclase [Gemmatimonadales bacterium]|nr:sensor domain-containing diguanylate cyclase [Gemmatimonadales bacterium]